MVMYLLSLVIFSITDCVRADDWGSTSVTIALNNQIARGHGGVYTGGKGVLVRNPFDGLDDASKAVVPASFWVNDIFAVSQLYPSGDPRMPMTKGDDDAWERAQLAFVIGSAMPSVMTDWDSIQEPDWGWGVFYAYDSNSVDQRCRWLPDKKLYDCPGGIIPWGKKFISKKVDRGAGGYPAGNPNVDANNGGGSGCHWGGAHGYYEINQFDGNDGRNTLLQNSHCECSYAFKTESWDPFKNGWQNWVTQMHDVGMGGNKVYSDFQDLSVCWVNNPRDMINLQNALYWRRTDWNDQQSPLADYYNPADYMSWRRYWGWNEVPVDKSIISNVENWDAVVIYLPAGACQQGVDTPLCLSSNVQAQLDGSLGQWVSKGYLQVGAQFVGKRPGSYVVFVRQNRDGSSNYGLEFFCQPWQRKGGKYKVVWSPMSKADPTGACFVDVIGIEGRNSTLLNAPSHDGPVPASSSFSPAKFLAPATNASTPKKTTSGDHTVPVSANTRAATSLAVIINTSYHTRGDVCAGHADQSSVTCMLNQKIAVGTDYGFYNGGKGVLVRNPFDGYEGKTEWQVVPTTFVSNDLVVPTTIFPTGWNGWVHGNGNPDCPNPKSNGFKPMPTCPQDSRTKETGPWNYATTAYVIATEMSQVFYKFEEIQTEDWGWGVFYPTDANAVDQRCRWCPDSKGYDCPGGWIPWGGKFQADATKKGSGAYPAGNPWANPAWGGGTGCHYGDQDKIIDQTPVDKPAKPLVADESCQCNYDFKSNWEDWITTWIQHAHNYRKQDGWFAGGSKKAPGHALDQVACWVNNPRDMINLQNHLYFRRYDWANQISPQSKWDNTKPETLRTYWGWNEVPISRLTARNDQLRDAVVIKLPAAICGGNGGDDSLKCLGKGQAENLEGDLDLWVNNNIMKVGVQYVASRPGSYVVIMREWMHKISGWSSIDNWSRWFFCENWVSPNNKYKIVFVQQSGGGVFPYGACYVEKASGVKTHSPAPSSDPQVFV